MAAQMTRLQYVQCAESLIDALDSSCDALDAMLDAHKLAFNNFRGRENDIDPITIAIALQAQALGIATIAEWLDALSTVTTTKYKTRGRNAWDQTQRKLEEHGIVLPDILLR